MKHSFLAALTLFSSLSYAGTTTTAVISKTTSSNLNVLRITVNNQTRQGEEIQTNSSLVPSSGKLVPAEDSVMFEIDNPQTEGIQKIRYLNSSVGCDFYLDTEARSFDGQTTSYSTVITAVPINNISLCEVHANGLVNHLTVGSVFSLKK